VHLCRDRPMDLPTSYPRSRNNSSNRFKSVRTSRRAPGSSRFRAAGSNRAGTDRRGSCTRSCDSKNIRTTKCAAFDGTTSWAQYSRDKVRSSATLHTRNVRRHLGTQPAARRTNGFCDLASQRPSAIQEPRMNQVARNHRAPHQRPGLTETTIQSRRRTENPSSQLPEKAIQTVAQAVIQAGGSWN